MFTPSWQSAESLIESMTQSPWRWQFAQALRIAYQTELPVDFKSDVTYQYPTSEVSQISFNRGKWQLESTLPSMSGYFNTLPYYYQDLEQFQRLNQDNRVLHDTFNLFNERILHLTGKITCRSNLGLRYEVRQQHGGQLAKTLLTLSAMPELSRVKYTAPENLLRYTGLLGRKSTSISKVTQILSDYFGIDLTPTCPDMERVYLAEDCPTQLSCKPKQKKHNVGLLGLTAVSGKSCYLPCARANMLINIHSRKAFDDLFSDPSLIPAIYEICNIYFSGSNWIKICIRCPRKFLKPPRLSAKPDPASASLSRSCCLCPSLKPDDCVIMDIPEVTRYASP